MSSRSTTRTVIWICVAFVVLAVFYGVRVAWLSVMAGEGDVPATSSVALPSGTTIVSEEKSCGSGGCWTELQVEPPDGQSADELAESLGATPQLQIAGNFFDPRTISVTAEPKGPMLLLRLDYFSGTYVP